MPEALALSIVLIAAALWNRERLYAAARSRVARRARRRPHRRGGGHALRGLGIGAARRGHRRACVLTAYIRGVPEHVRIRAGRLGAPGAGGACSSGAVGDSPAPARRGLLTPPMRRRGARPRPRHAACPVAPASTSQDGCKAPRRGTPSAPAPRDPAFVVRSCASTRAPSSQRTPPSPAEDSTPTQAVPTYAGSFLRPRRPQSSACPPTVSSPAPPTSSSTTSSISTAIRRSTSPRSSPAGWSPRRTRSPPRPWPRTSSTRTSIRRPSSSTSASSP